MNNYIYKKATLDDYYVIINMKDEVKERIKQEQLPIWLNGYPTNKMILDDIKQGHGRLIVNESNKVIAYAAFYPSLYDYPPSTFKNDNVYSFGRIMVCNEYLNMHCGSFLVKNMIDEAKTLAVDGMGILVDECNIKAVNLYKKFGFIKEGSNQFPYAYLDIYGLNF